MRAPSHIILYTRSATGPTTINCDGPTTINWLADQDWCAGVGLGPYAISEHVGVTKPTVHVVIICK
jgi:hypothetical protein